MVNEEKLIKEIKNFLVMKLGTNIYICRTNQLKGSNQIEVFIGVSIPRIIYDDNIKKQYIKFIKFNDVSKINFEINHFGGISAVANPKVIFDKVVDREKRLRVSVENIILDEIYPKLIKVSLIKDNLRPVYTILNKVFFDKEFTQRDITKYPKSNRLLKYLKFLEDYGIIRRNLSGNYVEGNIPIELQTALKNKDEIEVLAHTFGYVLKDGRKYLRDELNLRMLDTFIAIVTTYYYLSSRIGKIIQMSNETLLEEFRKVYYREVNSTKFFGYLTELQSADVLNKKNNLYFGDNSILNKVIGVTPA